MSKRFTRIICSNDEYTGSLYCNDEPLKIEEVCNLLNELHEENQHKQKLLHLAANKIDRLLEENEQLKSELKYYKAMVHTDTSR